ncbi:hypothetical protein Q4493_10130 [Colwellia sp. 1_MG-2023]|uniref:hypothetical protein n=1 Tax=Colwellia sp. 1_MG-2023 TaxID=3062649 RepID=UPI0026E40536|nr:hypothetical protein [Colwellia sp. 1_MG-2023]MDO6446132.1 hypothetical protein [Colwellia sp. 1_MG-2023]
MLYLYLGYLIIQLYPVSNKLFTENIAVSAIFFSLIVFLLWSFIPLIGYLSSMLIKILPKYNKRFFLAYGAMVALVENGLFYVDILTYEQNVLSTGISAALFFLVPFIPQSKT